MTASTSLTTTAPTAATVPPIYLERSYTGDYWQLVIPLLPAPLDRSAQVRVHFAPESLGGRRVEIVGDGRLHHIDKADALLDARQRIAATLDEAGDDARPVVRDYARQALPVVEARYDKERRDMERLWAHPGDRGRGDKRRHGDSVADTTTDVPTTSEDPQRPSTYTSWEGWR